MFEQFQVKFFEIFTGSNFYQEKTYLEYIANPQQNDEDNIVDSKIIEPLLIQALGFELGNISKNQTNRESKDNTRPDFQVELSQGNIRCFLVEDKNTAYNLSKPEPLKQLSDYARSRGYQLGLVCNGRLLLGWDLSNPNSPNPILHLDIQEIVETYSESKTGIEALNTHQIQSLKGLFRRFHRSNFEGIEKLIQDISKPESEWKLSAYSQDKHENFDELLINDLRESINLLEEDVLYQLDLWFEEYDEFCQAKYLPNGNGNGSSDADELETAPKIVIKLRKEILNYFRASGAGLLELDDYSWAEEKLIEFADNPQGSIQELWDKFLQRRKKAETKQQAIKAQKNQNAEIYEQLDLLSPVSKVKQQELGIKITPQAKITKLDDKLVEKLKDYDRLVLDWKAWEAQQRLNYDHAIKTNQYYTTWKNLITKTVLQGSDEAKLKSEFARQTAYVYVIRLLIVRICEDKGLINRKFSNGGFKNWRENVIPQYLDLAEGAGMDYLLEMSYRSAQNIYAHFFSQEDLFNWYRLSQNTLIKILHILNRFNLAEIDSDIIGVVYGRYVMEGKHEQGRYFTPKNVVEYMLDTLGYTSNNPEIRDKTLLDLAGGSGSFLVHAARRLINSYRNKQEKIPIENIPLIIQQVKNSLFCMDINPFACYLAETNLLIQVIDLLKQAKDQGRLPDCTIDRFNVYNTDSLLLPKRENIRTPLLNPILNLELLIVDKIKTKSEEFSEGFDFVVGNPPYVRADEPGMENYRREIKQTGRFATLHEKWDLFVPFVELSCKLNKNNGKIGLIVSRGIQTNNYAELLRNFVAENLKIIQVDFFNNVRLFTDAMVNNTIFFLENVKPESLTQVKRVLHSNTLEQIELLEPLSQQNYQGKVFRQFINTQNLENVIDLEKICYCSIGMVLNADEKLGKGEFKKDELIQLQSDLVHSKKYIDGENIIRNFALNSIRYLEWNTSRVPGKIRRVTIPELYDFPKILFGMTSYPTYDRGMSHGDGFYVPHSVRVCIKWDTVFQIKRLANEPRQMYEFSKKQQRILGEGKGKKVKIYEYAQQQADFAKNFDLRYIVAILASDLGKRFLLENNRDENIMRVGSEGKPAKSSIYPDDLKEFPIKNIPFKQQKPLINCVDILVEGNWEIYQYCQEGHQIKFDYAQKEPQIKIDFLRVFEQLNIPTWSFLNSEPQRVEVIGDRHQPITKVKVNGDQLYLGKMPLLRSDSPLVLEYLKSYLPQFEQQGSTWTDLLSSGKIPKEDAGIEAIFAECDRLRETINRKIETLRQTYQELNQKVNQLYLV